MAIVKGIGIVPVLEAWGTIGRSNGCGRAQCGVTLCGDDFDPEGTYKRDGRWNTNRIIKCAQYAPTNPQTAPQQARRSKFADGVADWHSLTDAQKKKYQSRATRIGLNGFMLHQRDWMNA